MTLDPRGTGLLFAMCFGALFWCFVILAVIHVMGEV